MDKEPGLEWRSRCKWQFHESSKKMRVNGAKTKLLCISDAKSYDTAVHDAEGNKIEESNTLKIFGFHFSKKPTMQAQVDSILRGALWLDFGWLLTSLITASMNRTELNV